MLSKEILKKYNWEIIQKYYDDGNSWRKTVDEFSLNNSTLHLAMKEDLFKTRTKSSSTKLSLEKNPRKLSQVTKDKLSRIRKEYLKNNPDKVPYKLNHSSKESYPEKYFSDLFVKENIKVERYYYIGIYELDFCLSDKKIDIEIDGEQHYVDDRIKKGDEVRNNYLENLGWTIIRIRWKDYQKLSIDEKKNYISELKIKLGM